MKVQKRKKLLNNKGQGVMEYMIISSLVGVLCLYAVRDFGTTVNSKIEQVNKKINKIKIK